MIWIRWKHHSHSKTLPDLSLVNSSLTKATTSTVPLPIWAMGYSTFPYTGGVGSHTRNPPKQKKKIHLPLFNPSKVAMHGRTGRLYVLLYNGIYLHCRCLPESPRWLISQGKNDKAMKIVSDMAKKNRKKMPSHFKVSSGSACAYK